ncbi:MAG: type II toxin-antitoxin system RelE/ParE family toxin [Deltaproteobacteria bacterium]|nr:type II toxin-antitoxin system RelE/ParE family toxin [Deltaproteobacteria bacterium]
MILKKYLYLGTQLMRRFPLGGNRKGQYAISINKQWRVCFEWNDSNAHHVEIVDYH